MIVNNYFPYPGQQQQPVGPLYPGGYGNIPLPSNPAKTELQSVNVSLKSLPFYDLHSALVTPTALVHRGGNRYSS